MDLETSRAAPADDVDDVHARSDGRRLAVDAVGIRALRHPIAVEDAGRIQHTVATVRLAVELAPERRGAHMSRFIELLMERTAPFSVAGMAAFLGEIAERLGAHAAEAELRFPYFLGKRAPVSRAASYVDYETCLSGRLAGGRAETELEVRVPVTSLCPCSKEIADYGAHNQRSHIRVAVHEPAQMTLCELIELVEAQASAPVYGLLKRVDEKHLTERAYDNPKFVEDTVRDVALALRAHPGVTRFRVEAENFESIHNHSAYAVIRADG